MTNAQDNENNEDVTLKGIARLGNGNDQELSQEELDMIDELYNLVLPLQTKLKDALNDDFCDHETCRRYLVARQWKLEKAEHQLTSTLKWRLEENPCKLQFWQSPKALENPHALSMRIIGLDSDGRPIAYTCFAEAHDRWDVEANLQHMLLLMEASCQVVKQRRDSNLNQTASSRQWVWIVDFDGFGLRDQNPKSAYFVSKLMQHYPEMLHLAVLLNAPQLFSGVFRLIRPVLDERVLRKIMFERVKTSQDAVKALEERIGSEATAWIVAETKDNLEKRADAKNGNAKKYWVPPENDGEHDARGMASYVNSEYYVKTPGDAFLETSPNK